MQHKKISFLTFILLCAGIIPLQAQTVKDIDENIYHTVTIGTQTWMVENLKTTHYYDGTAIPLATGDTTTKKMTTPAYCLYNNDGEDTKNKYGAFYNWYAVNTGKLAPKGWHVATDADWTILETYVKANPGASGSASKALAATTEWNEGEIGKDPTNNNSSGFGALPGGYLDYDGSFKTQTKSVYWWSSTRYNENNALYRTLNCFYGLLRGNNLKFGNVFYVRCVKD